MNWKEIKLVNQEEFEKLIMEKLLNGNNKIFVDLYRQYQQAIVTSREFTGCGFFTKFDIQGYKPKYLVSGRIDDVAVEFEKADENACFILYVKTGKIDTLEGFCFGGAWNDDYGRAKIVYCLPNQRRYELK